MRPSPTPRSSLAQRLATWGVALLGLWNLGRAAVLGRQAAWLVDWQIEPNPSWRLVMASVWAAAFLGSALAIRRGASWARIGAPLLVAAYGIYGAVLLFHYDGALPSLALPLVYGLSIVFLIWALNRRPI